MVRKLFPIAYFDKEAFLNQSPQLYKQMMMAAGFEKVFETGPIFRAEEHNTTKHLNEATSIDIEVSYADHLEVMRILEELIVKTYEYVSTSCGTQLASLEITDFAVPRTPFPRLPYSEAIEIAKTRIEDPIGYGDDISPAAERAIGSEMGGHYFIVDWPSAIRPYYAMPYEDDPSVCKAFDLMHPRMELSSGAQRIHQHDLLVRQIREKRPRSGKFRILSPPVQVRYAPSCRLGIGSRSADYDDAWVIECARGGAIPAGYAPADPLTTYFFYCGGRSGYTINYHGYLWLRSILSIKCCRPPWSGVIPS